MSVDAWARKAIALYRKHACAYIGVEANLGDACSSARSAPRSFEEAQAAHREPGAHRGQASSPCAERRHSSANARQLYPHVVSHVGIHARLEETMTTHDYGTSKRSPGDLDALSLGCADMVLQQPEPQRLASDDYDGV